MHLVTAGTILRLWRTYSIANAPAGRPTARWEFHVRGTG
jgi:hypothetical protein